MQEVEAASEHEEHDAWQGVHTLSLAYVPAGQFAMHSFFKGLRLSLEHFVQVTRGVVDLLAEGSSEHSAQFSMPPLLASLHGTHLFPALSSALGKSPDPHPDASTQEVESPAVLRYLPVSHFVHMTLLLAYVQTAHPVTPAAAGVRPVFAPLHDWQVFRPPVAAVCPKYPSGHLETQEVAPSVSVFRYKSALHSVHISFSWPSLEHVLQFSVTQLLGLLLGTGISAVCIVLILDSLPCPVTSFAYPTHASFRASLHTPLPGAALTL